jgi:hypothetical protein
MTRLFTARAAMLGALLFAIAMTALEQGGWWWAVFIVATSWITGIRLPLLSRFRLPSTHRYIISENRKTRRNNRRITRERRRARNIARKMRRTRQ